jgi:subfamily B ATP-binding cassette protein MsbA
LLRFYQPRQGEILLDGRDIRDYQLSSLRQQIAMVGQDVVLFNDSIAHNIAYGRPGEATRGDIAAAAARAHATEFIDALPQGLDSPVGDRGMLLSGGQRQRVAIARALFKDAPVLILDEATSSLDSESERVVQDALEILSENRTSLVIAHRLSTVEKADRILVMEAGRIIDTGSHSELLQRGGLYADLYRLQFKDPPAL